MKQFEQDEIAETCNETIISKEKYLGFKHEIEPYIYIHLNNKQYKRFKLTQQTTTLGRGPGVDIILSDPSISRKHALVKFVNDEIHIEDLNSTNGTFVNGISIQDIKLEPTDRINMGELELKVDYKKMNEIRQEDSIYLAANTDCLTGLSNRRAFMNRAEEELSYSQRNDSKMTLILCDIDHFKQINDKYGHLAGDAVIKELAGMIDSKTRKEDMLARYGGEEFIILLRDIDEKSAFNWAERMRTAIADNKFCIEEKIIRSTISAGVCTRNGSEISTLNGMIKAADVALYQAKSKGRNQVTVM